MNKSLFPVFYGHDSKLPYIIRSAGHTANQEDIKRPNGYPHYHILICKIGSGMLKSNESNIELSKGRGFFCHPNIPHEYYALKEPWETIWLTFEGQGVQSLLNSIGMGYFEDINPTNGIKLAGIIEKIIDFLDSENIDKGYLSSVLLYEFLLEFMHCFSNSSNNSERSAPGRLKSVFAYIDENCCLEVTLEDLSRLLGITQRHFCRLFRQNTGQTPFEYITQKRIQKAKELLAANRNTKISEIALNTGFFSTSYFCRTFKRIEGITPSQFKVTH